MRVLIALGILNLIFLAVIANLVYDVRWDARATYEDRLARIRNTQREKENQARQEEATKVALEERPRLTWSDPDSVRSAANSFPVPESGELTFYEANSLSQTALIFEADKVILSLKSSRVADPETPAFSAILVGRAEMGHYTRRTSTWLPAFVNFRPAAYFDGKKAYNLLWQEDAAAEISYWEAGSEFSRYHGGDALVSIELKLETSVANHPHGMLRVLQDEALRPRIELCVHFTEHDSIREKFGIPTWDGFLRSECKAFSSEYTFSFSRMVDMGQQDDVRTSGIR